MRRSEHVQRTTRLGDVGGHRLAAGVRSADIPAPHVHVVIQVRQPPSRCIYGVTEAVARWSRSVIRTSGPANPATSPLSIVPSPPRLCRLKRYERRLSAMDKVVSRAKAPDRGVGTLLHTVADFEIPFGLES